MILDTTTKSIQVVLAGAVAANQLECVSSYVDVPSSGRFFPGASDVATNGVTPVTFVAAPGANVARQVKELSIFNADTAPALVTVRYDDAATIRRIVSGTLAVGSTWNYANELGWRVTDATGAVLTVGQPGLLQRARVVLTDAQVKALPTTAVPILGAPGSGLAFQVMAATYHLNSTAGAYTNLDTTYSSLWIGASVATYQTTDIANDSTVSMTRLSLLLGVAQSVIAEVACPYLVSVNGAALGDSEYLAPGSFPGTAAVTNVALNVGLDNNGSGNLTGGNAANTLTVDVWYVVRPA